MICWIIKPSFSIYSQSLIEPKKTNTLWHATGNDKSIQCNGNLHAGKSILAALNYIDWSLFKNLIVAYKINAENYHSLMDNKMCVVDFKPTSNGKDITNILHSYACDMAESLLSSNSDSRSRDVIQAKREWLKGKISLNDLQFYKLAAEKVYEGYGYCSPDKNMKNSPTGSIPASYCGSDNPLIASGWMFRHDEFSKKLEELIEM